jgi:hypothetical protein
VLSQDASVPQSWFLHFYAIGALFNGLLLVVYSCQYGERRAGAAGAQLPTVSSCWHCCWLSPGTGSAASWAGGARARAAGRARAAAHRLGPAL